MAFNKAPTALFSGYEFDGTNISIPIEDIIGLTPGEAHATTGDWRNIWLPLCYTVLTYVDNLPTADKPVAITVDLPSITRIRSGSLSGSLKQTYQFVFYNELPDTNVVDEPT